MARSRSMEAISQEAGKEEEQAGVVTAVEAGLTSNRPKHYCTRDDVRRPERPRTALATMRTSQHGSHPEFEKRSSGQGGEPGVVQVVTGDQIRSLIVPYASTTFQPLLLSRRDYDKIKRAAVVLTSAERDAIRADKEEEREAALQVYREPQRQSLCSQLHGYQLHGQVSWEPKRCRSTMLDRKGRAFRCVSGSLLRAGLTRCSKIQCLLISFSFPPLGGKEKEINRHW